MYMQLYGKTNNVNGGARNDLHMLARFVMRLQQSDRLRQCSRGVDLLTLSEYHINKDFTGLQAQATGHRRCKNVVMTV